MEVGLNDFYSLIRRALNIRRLAIEYIYLQKDSPSKLGKKVKSCDCFDNKTHHEDWLSDIYNDLNRIKNLFSQQVSLDEGFGSFVTLLKEYIFDLGKLAYQKPNKKTIKESVKLLIELCGFMEKFIVTLEGLFGKLSLTPIAGKLQEMSRITFSRRVKKTLEKFTRKFTLFFKKKIRIKCSVVSGYEF